MEKRALGSSGLEVSALGLGCMTMSDFYGSDRDEQESIRTIHRSLELGVGFLDTSDMYGVGENEKLVGKAIKDRRHEVTLATKFGVVRDKGPMWEYNGRAEYVKAAAEASLRRLGVDHIDLYYLHRIDPYTPIEETVGAMADLVKEGKVRYIGLSEASPDMIRRAHAVHPLSAVQTEYSLWSRDIEDEVLPTLRELGIGFVAYSPLGRGFLTGTIQRYEDLAYDDIRRNFPRFQGQNLQKNLQFVARIQEMAAEKECTAPQLALKWILMQGSDIVPIPGTKRRKYLEENIGALQVELTESDLKRIHEVAPKNVAAGHR
ncbi:aldo/keto reductase [Paenibacillus donghaensis]|uniref:aldo/keto reductase n=1 Tax=Paenibacillus donghaensis TaxID=414771 RepID=UPI001884799A|nr:aldo/keto reductase [Paenibacillus donghaensis]MBE9913490.1 aldo/keto reductase [Paenibacillus donghaensis]